MSNPKVSVIVPVYNVSRYLEKCLDSIINQTLEDIEIIIINDCSPDPRDDRICRKYAENDDRIVYLIHQENLGIGGARNSGIRLAKAEYIGFVDSDDFINLDLFETIYNEAIKDDNDVVVFGFCRVNENYRVIDKSLPNGYVDGDLFRYFLEGNNTMNPASWNKLWKKSLYIDNGIVFPLHAYYEDLSTTARVLFFAKNVKYLKRVFYNYRTRNESVVLSYSIKHIDDMFFAILTIKEFLCTVGRYDNYKIVLQDRFFRMVKYYITTGLDCATESIKKANLLYLRDKIINNDLVSVNYLFSRLDYTDLQLLFDGKPAYFNATRDLSITARLGDERDNYRKERDVARGERDIFRKEREAARGERDIFRKEREAARGERDIFRKERDVAREESNSFRKERDIAREKVEDSQSEIKILKSNKWYRFGELSKSGKVRIVTKVVAKRTHTYWLFKIFSKS